MKMAEDEDKLNRFGKIIIGEEREHLLNRLAKTPDYEARKATGESLELIRGAILEGFDRGLWDTEEGKEKLHKLMVLPITPIWGPAPEGSLCLACGAPGLERSRILFAPWGGSVRCPSCGHHESVYSYLGKKCLKVEPLPEGT
jgi:hypothetical protein